MTSTYGRRVPVWVSVLFDSLPPVEVSADFCTIPSGMRRHPRNLRVDAGVQRICHARKIPSRDLPGAGIPPPVDAVVEKGRPPVLQPTGCHLDEILEPSPDADGEGPSPGLFCEAVHQH